MFAFIIGYFHDNLYLVVLMNIFTVSCGCFKWLSLWLYRTWMFADGVTTFICLELRKLPLLRDNLVITVKVLHLVFEQFSRF
jgi:hypothetical protein